MYITGHFDTPFEGYRLDSAVYDLVSATGVPRASLLPLTCFLYKGYLWTLNNRRLWVLRHAFQFTGRDEDIDVIVLPESALPERKDYVAGLPFHKQAAMAAPKFLPVIHGDQPKLQKLVMKPIDVPVRGHHAQRIQGPARWVPYTTLLLLVLLC